MKKAEIRVGGIYLAKVNGMLANVRVDEIRQVRAYAGMTTHYEVINLKSGRKTVFRSAAKFRSEVVDEGKRPIPVVVQEAIKRTAPALSKALEYTEEEYCIGDEPDCCEGEDGEECPGCGKMVKNQRPPVSDKTEPSIGSFLSSVPTEVLAPHVIVVARAGSGKTTVLIEGLKKVKGLPTPIIPSIQQAKVWEAMMESKDATSILFCAFNKSIAEELKRRVPPGCDASTMHSLGYKAVQKHFGRQEPTNWALTDVVSELMGMDSREIRKNPRKFTILQGTEALVAKCKQNLVDGKDREELERLASYYDIDLEASSEEVYDLVPRALERCLTPKGKISFDDMVWLPVVLDLPMFRYDLLLGDEVQDWNRCQQQLAMKSGKRLVLVGDDRQSVYAFAGADSDSIDRMYEQLSKTERGCIKTPLTVTRRCGKEIVRKAQEIVPDFEFFESNCEGEILTAKYGKKEDDPAKTYIGMVQEGDFLLCRVNSPLVSQCFRFLKMGRKATIQGRDVGQGLISTLKKLNALDVVDLTSKLSDWYHKETQKENAKKYPNENKLIALGDRYDCLQCFCADVTTVEEVIAKIERIFTDDKSAPGIKLSSIHRAKGLEARRVFLLEPEGATVPHPMARSAWQRKQEYNLRYVAITRAIETLVFVS